MTSIPPLGPLLARIRAQVLQHKDARSRTATPAGAQRASGDLLNGVVARVAELSSELPDRRRRAFRLFLQAVLAGELAVEDPNGPAFQDLVDRVLASMESDARLQQAMDQAGDFLLERSRR